MWFILPDASTLADHAFNVQASRYHEATAKGRLDPVIPSDEGRARKLRFRLGSGITGPGPEDPGRPLESRTTKTPFSRAMMQAGAANIHGAGQRAPTPSFLTYLQEAGQGLSENLDH